MFENNLCLQTNNYKYNMALTTKAKQLIRDRKGLRIRNRLALEMNVTAKTIDVWLANDAALLSSSIAADVLVEETGMNVDELILKENDK